MNQQAEAERYWAKVHKTDGCWLWTASKDGRYGVFRVGNRPIKAHRLSWILAHGNIAAGKKVLHRCDTPLCVNPGHLFLGSQHDNVLDMEAKGRGRHPRGSQNGFAKLNEESVRAIKESSESLSVLGRRYGVAKQTIHKIRHGLNWAHV